MLQDWICRIRSHETTWFRFETRYEFTKKEICSVAYLWFASQTRGKWFIFETNRNWRWKLFMIKIYDNVKRKRAIKTKYCENQYSSKKSDTLFLWDFKGVFFFFELLLTINSTINFSINSKVYQLDKLNIPSNKRDLN